MATDNFVTDPGVGGSTFRALNDGTALWPSCVVAYATTIGDPDALQVVDASHPLPVTAATLPLPSGAATSALQGGGLPAALGAGGGLKVDGSGTALPVSGGVTVSGTCTATLSAETTKIIGTINIASAQTLATVTTVSTVTNLSQLGGQAIAMGTGARTAGTLRVTIATDDVVPASQSGTWNIGTVTAVTSISNALPAGTNAIGKLAANSGVDIGDVDVTSISAGVNLIGDVGLQPRTSGGLSFSKLISAASTNLTQIKGSAGQLYGLFATNINAAVRYLKVYNAPSASVNVGTTVPDLTLPIPANAAGAGFYLKWPQGVAFSTGISIALTTGVADNDTGAVAANELTVHAFYK